MSGATQKERATELLCEADLLEMREIELVDRLHAAHEKLSARQKLECTVRDRVHPGTTLRFPGVQTTLRTPLAGPVIVSCEGPIMSRRVVVRRGTDDASHTLDSRPVPEDAQYRYAKLLAVRGPIASPSAAHAA
jgi:hypothetical protein